MVGVLTSWREKNDLNKRGVRVRAKIPKENSPREAEVNWTSGQPNRPVPRISWTISTLNKNINREMGITKKRICLKVEEKFSKNSSLAPSAQARERAGKAAMAKEAPIMPMGKWERLLAKLKTAMLPITRVEAMAVMTIKLI